MIAGFACVCGVALAWGRARASGLLRARVLTLFSCKKILGVLTYRCNLWLEGVVGKMLLLFGGGGGGGGGGVFVCVL